MNSLTPLLTSAPGYSNSAATFLASSIKDILCGREIGGGWEKMSEFSQKAGGLCCGPLDLLCQPCIEGEGWRNWTARTTRRTVKEMRCVAEKRDRGDNLVEILKSEEG
jgi:hypothetical protein